MSTNILLTLAKGLSRAGHEDQMYGGRPYSYHIDCVVSKVGFLFGESPKLSSLKIVAYLHDLLEDTSTSPSDLFAYGFSQEIVDAIVAISKIDGESLEDYYVRVVKNKLAFKVKIVDTLSNLEHSCPESQTKRIKKYTNQIQRLYELKGK